jgi:ferredoxin
MPMRVNQEKCIQCNDCRHACPNGGIFEIDAVYIIDPTRCTECIWVYDHPHCVDVCPVNAIEKDRLNEVDEEVLVSRAARLYPGFVPAD